MLTEKKQSRIEKLIGAEAMQEMEKLSADSLKGVVAAEEGKIKQAEDELEANEKYQELKESLKDVSLATREAKKFHRAAAQYALHLIEEAGK